MNIEFSSIWDVNAARTAASTGTEAFEEFIANTLKDNARGVRGLFLQGRIGDFARWAIRKTDKNSRALVVSGLSAFIQHHNRLPLVPRQLVAAAIRGFGQEADVLFGDDTLADDQLDDKLKAAWQSQIDSAGLSDTEAWCTGHHMDHNIHRKGSKSACGSPANQWSIEGAPFEMMQSHGHRAFCPRCFPEARSGEVLVEVPPKSPPAEPHKLRLSEVSRDGQERALALLSRLRGAYERDNREEKWTAVRTKLRTAERGIHDDPELFAGLPSYTWEEYEERDGWIEDLENLERENLEARVARTRLERWRWWRNLGNTIRLPNVIMQPFRPNRAEVRRLLRVVRGAGRNAGALTDTRDEVSKLERELLPRLELAALHGKGLPPENVTGGIWNQIVAGLTSVRGWIDESWTRDQQVALRSLTSSMGAIWGVLLFLCTFVFGGLLTVFAGLASGAALEVFAALLGVPATFYLVGESMYIWQNPDYVTWFGGDMIALSALVIGTLMTFVASGILPIFGNTVEGIPAFIERSRNLLLGKDTKPDAGDGYPKQRNSLTHGSHLFPMIACVDTVVMFIVALANMDQVPLVGAVAMILFAFIAFFAQIGNVIRHNISDKTRRQMSDTGYRSIPVVIVALVLVLLGLLAGYVTNRWVDAQIESDIVMTIVTPSLVLAIVIGILYLIGEPLKQIVSSTSESTKGSKGFFGGQGALIVMIGLGVFSITGLTVVKVYESYTTPGHTTAAATRKPNLKLTDEQKAKLTKAASGDYFIDLPKNE